MLLNTKPHVKSNRNIEPTTEALQNIWERNSCSQIQINSFNHSAVSFPVNTAHSFAVGLEATQGHSSTTATKALLQKSSSVLAIHLVGLQAGSGVRRDLQTAILTQN